LAGLAAFWPMAAWAALASIRPRRSRFIGAK
jgi:hypothetical protein